MLRRETSHKYENKIGTTKFVVESESSEDCKVDMVDSLVALIKRDLENISLLSKKRSSEIIEFSTIQENASDGGETR